MVTVQSNVSEQTLFSKVFMPVTHKVLLALLDIESLTNFPFGIFIFKALYGSFLEILKFQQLEMYEE